LQEGAGGPGTYEQNGQEKGPESGREPMSDEHDEEVLVGEGPCLAEKCHGVACLSPTSTRAPGYIGDASEVAQTERRGGYPQWSREEMAMLYLSEVPGANTV
jgi:hypothetical protein